MLFAECGTVRRTLVHVCLCHTCRMRSRISVPAHPAACSACGDIVCPRACTVRGNYTVGSYPPVRPLVHARELPCARARVRDLGGRGSNGRAMAGTASKGVDSVRRRQVAAPSGPAAGTPLLRLPPSPQPAHSGAVCTRRVDDHCRSGQNACTRTEHGPYTVQHVADTSNRRCAANIMQMSAGWHSGALSTTRLRGGEHATSKVARATIAVHGAWHLHPCAMRLRDEITKWSTQRVPAGTTVYLGRCGTAAPLTRTARTGRAQLRSSNACRRQAVRRRHGCRALGMGE